MLLLFLFLCIVNLLTLPRDSPGVSSYACIIYYVRFVDRSTPSYIGKILAILFTALSPRPSDLEKRESENDNWLVAVVKNFFLCVFLETQFVYDLLLYFDRSAGFHFFFFKRVRAVPAVCVHIRFLVGTLQLLYSNAPEEITVVALLQCCRHTGWVAWVRLCFCVTHTLFWNHYY